MKAPERLADLELVGLLELAASRARLAAPADLRRVADTIAGLALEAAGRLAHGSSAAARFDLERHLERQAAFSDRTFGPGIRTAGVVDHIRRELLEIEAAPRDLEEWIDVVILAFDGARRSGASPAAIVAALESKQTLNERRAWPDWRTADTDRAITPKRGPA